MLVDCDGITSNKRMDVEAAEASAKAVLLDEEEFLLALDVRSLCDPEKPSAGQRGASSSSECGNVRDEMTKMESWEARLLDLSFNNELIRMRMSDTLLPIMTDNLAALRDAVSSGNVFTASANRRNGTAV